MWALLFLFILLFFMYIWHARMHLKEEAFTLVKIEASKHEYQILDDAIGLSSLRCIRSGWKFVLLYTYEFHYADLNQQRHIGRIQRQGQQWLTVEFHVPVFDNTEPRENNVIAFPGRHEHD